MMHYHQIEFHVYERQQRFLDEAARYRLYKELPAPPRHQRWSIRFVIDWFRAYKAGRGIELRFGRSRPQQDSG
jgi:hypothetical protein